MTDLNNEVPEEALSQSRDNASRVAEEWNAHQGKAMDGSYRTVVGGVDVLVRDIRYGEDENGVAWVDVWTGNTSRPAFRIMNPPTLVQDSRGPIAIREETPEGTVRIVRHREDPVEAIAEVVAKVRAR